MRCIVHTALEFCTAYEAVKPHGRWSSTRAWPQSWSRRSYERRGERRRRALLALRRTIAQGELVNLRRTELGTG